MHYMVFPIGKTPVRIILWCPTTKMLIKACFLIQPLEQEGGYQKCCISLCSKVFANHFCQMKASPEWLNILIYWSKYRIDRLRRTLRRKFQTGIFYQQIHRFCHYILRQVAHIDCSASSGKQHEPLTAVWGSKFVIYNNSKKLGYSHLINRFAINIDSQLNISDFRSRGDHIVCLFYAQL